MGTGTNTYRYSADGRKLQVRKQQGFDITTTDYVGTRLYENGSLKRFLIDGGYIEGGNYFFYLTDHLGSTRVVARADGTIMQTNHYYPYGLTFAEGIEDSNQRYKFNGKEFDTDLGLNYYDFGARLQDPVLGGRFGSRDPMSRKYYPISPYAYCAGNPVKFVDPTGMEWYSYMQYEYDEDGNITSGRRQYEYRETAMSESEMQQGNYTHEGLTYMSGDTYYSLGGAKISFDSKNPFSLMGLQSIVDADMLIMGTVNSLEAAGSFWDKYKDFIGTGSSAATVFGEFMGASEGFRGAANKIGVIYVGSQLLKYDSRLRGVDLTDAAFDVVSLAGWQGAAVSFSYSGAKAAASWTMRLEVALRTKMEQLRRMGPGYW